MAGGRRRSWTRRPCGCGPWRDEDADAVLAGQTRDQASLLWAGGSDLRSRDDAVARVDRMRNGGDRAS